MSSAQSSVPAGLPLGRDVTVIKSDANGLMAFAKPAGVLSHPNEPGDEAKALLQAPYTMDGEFYRWTDGGSEHRLWLLNRLDSATSGVILACDSEALAQVMRLHFRQKRVRKIYHTLVFGRPMAMMQLWRDRLAVQKKGGQIRTSGAGNIPAECRMTVVRSKGAFSHLRLEPITGRSHQLRVQCAKRNLPIVGDATYGDFGRNREFAKTTGIKRLFLHSQETAFDYEFRGQRHHFAAIAPLPPEFENVL